jgi:hypothetical protein
MKRRPRIRAVVVEPLLLPVAHDEATDDFGVSRAEQLRDD